MVKFYLVCKTCPKKRFFFPYIAKEASTQAQAQNASTSASKNTQAQAQAINSFRIWQNIIEYGVTLSLKGVAGRGIDCAFVR